MPSINYLNTTLTGHNVSSAYPPSPPISDQDSTLRDLRCRLKLIGYVVIALSVCVVVCMVALRHQGQSLLSITKQISRLTKTTTTNDRGFDIYNGLAGGDNGGVDSGSGSGSSSGDVEMRTVPGRQDVAVEHEDKLPAYSVRNGAERYV